MPLVDVGGESLLSEEPVKIRAGYAEACDGYPQILYLLDRGTLIGSIIIMVKVTKYLAFTLEEFYKLRRTDLRT